MGPEAVNIVNRRDIEAAEDKEERRRELVDQYRQKFANPILPLPGLGRRGNRSRHTRIYLLKGLEMLREKRDQRPMKKHSNRRYKPDARSVDFSPVNSKIRLIWKATSG